MATSHRKSRETVQAFSRAAAWPADKNGPDLRVIADAMPQLAWIALPDGTVDYFNQSWHEFTGREGGLSGGAGWLAAVCPEDRPRCLKEWQRAISGGEPFQADCRLKRGASGDYLWHRIRAVAVRGANGRVINWFGICSEAEDQRSGLKGGGLNGAPDRSDARQAAQLMAVTKELEALSYSVSHDLRAPLRSINAFSQLLLEEYQNKLDEQGGEYLRILIESSAQLARMIEGLLQVSRIGRGELGRQPVDLTAVARQIIARLQEAGSGRDMDVVITPDLKTNGDERLLWMALENLLGNAWKFTSQQDRARIEFGSETQAGSQVFFVRDNGAGFDPEYAGKLFGTFQRLHSQGEYPGLGIGLAMVQRIISRHGGRVWAEAAVDKGATFYFTIPQENQRGPEA